MKNFFLTLFTLVLATLSITAQETNDGIQFRPVTTPQVTAEMVAKNATTPGAARMVGFNMTTHQVETLPEATQAAPFNGKVPDVKAIQSLTGYTPEGTVADEAINPALTFYPLALANSTTSYPQCTNVKIFIRWPNNSWVVGSGTLIDNQHVLTAGHCMYSAADGGWAAEMYVVPAYDNGSEPFGRAYANYQYCNTAWTGSTDWNFDYGFIRLDRPVGALTGWLGLGYNTANSFFSGNTFHNYCYPAASPYNGQKMYYRYGLYDWLTADLLYFACEGYGGTSGSGAYYKNDNNNRYVYGVMSHGTTINGQQRSGQVRLTEWKFNQIKNQMAANTPATVDLTPLKFRLSNTTLSSGNSYTISCLVHNKSTQAFSGNVTAKIYLSSNDIITAASDWQLVDVNLGYYSIPAKGSAWVSYTTTLPVPSGYNGTSGYAGIILTNSDSNSGNNASNGWDAQSVTVIKAPTVANDNPNIAIYLQPYSSAFYTNGTNVNATQTTYPALTSCSSNNTNYTPIASDKDVWYYTIIPSSGIVTIRTLAGTMSDAVMYLYGSYSNTSPDLYYVVCEDDNDSYNTMPVRTVSGTPGERVYIRIFGYAGTAGSFQICVLNYSTSNMTGGGGTRTQIEDGDQIQDLESAEALELRAETNTQTATANNTITLAPNPASDFSTATFELQETTTITAQLFDLQGRIARNLPGQVFEKGSNSITIPVQDLPGGLYFLHLNGNTTATEVIKLQVMHGK